MKFYQNWKGTVLTGDDKGFEFAANIPGNIQNDYAIAKNWGDLNFSDNCLKYKDIEEVTWQYKTKLNFKKNDNERVYFVSHGIDYFSSLSLNGKELLRHEGMFSDVEYDLTDILTGDDELCVTIYPHPKRENAPKDTRDEADTSVKPPVCYGWDWHPRILYSGIWQETYIETRTTGFIKDVQIHYTLSDDFTTAKCNFDVICEEETKVEIFDKQGSLVYSGDGKDFEIKDVDLWWCNGHGEPNLYSYKVSSSDYVKEGKIGFKSIKLVMAQGEWSKPNKYPMSRSNPPICLELNGKRIFAKGTNMPTPEIFPGIVTKERYQQMLTLVKNANMNIVRMWGGCGIQKNVYYNLCDEMGIMVWQEFPLACNHYGAYDCDHYCRVLNEEAKSIIKRLRNNVSLVLWCGGNELFNSWSLMTDQSYPLRLLNKLTLELSPEIPFIMTAPVSGMAHGPYSFCGDSYRTLIEVFQESNGTAYTEFGCWSISPVEFLKTFLTEEEINNHSHDAKSVWALHHGNEKMYYRGGDKISQTLNLVRLNRGDYDQKQKVMEWLQAEGLRFVFEEGRRQAPTCSMTINWFFTQPWKVIAGDSLVLYPDVLCPSYYTVKDALRPVVASARYKKFDWCAGEVFTAEMWLLNDTLNAVEDTITAVLELDGVEYELATWNTGLTDKNVLGPTAHILLPDASCEYMTLKLISKNGFSSKYNLRYYPSQNVVKPKVRQMNVVNDVD